jgi:hypothetical protein
MTFYEDYRRVIFEEEQVSAQGRRWLSTVFQCGRDAAVLQGLDRAILHVLAEHFRNGAPTMVALHRELEMCLETGSDPSTRLGASGSAARTIPV